MTHDVNAVIRGARKAGADRIVIKDGHASCKNLLIDQLEPGVELISGLGPVRDGMMDGIDGSFSAAMLVGYHGMAGLQTAMMDHALTSGLWRFWINDREAGEILTNSAVAGAYGVPVVLVTSDEVGCQEAGQAVPGVATVATKTGLGRFMGRLAPPSETGPLLEDAAARSIGAIAEVRPVSVGSPVKMRVAFRSTEEAEMAATVAGVDRTDGYSLEWTRPSVLEAHRTALLVFQISTVGRRSGQ